MKASVYYLWGSDDNCSKKTLYYIIMAFQTSIEMRQPSRFYNKSKLLSWLIPFFGGGHLVIEQVEHLVHFVKPDCGLALLQLSDEVKTHDMM